MAHVLLVEDERLVALAFRAALEGEGHRVTAVGDGLSAIAADLADPAEVLVTDLRMPRMGGRELVRHLRQHTPGLPVVVLSGHTDDAGELLDGAGATVLLGKPVSPDTLVEVVAVLVGRRRSPAADALAAAPAAAPPPVA